MRVKEGSLLTKWVSEMFLLYRFFHSLTMLMFCFLWKCEELKQVFMCSSYISISDLKCS